MSVAFKKNCAKRTKASENLESLPVSPKIITTGFSISYSNVGRDSPVQQVIEVHGPTSELVLCDSLLVALNLPE
jgi:hypothetical protein